MAVHWRAECDRYLHCETTGMRILLRAAVLVACMLTARASSAAPIAVGDLLHFTGSTGTLGGGAFLIDDVSNGAGVDFMSFCVQMTQHVDYSQLFRVGSITNYADDASGNDPLSSATQWIFSSFQAGLLNNYSADEIQAAIWKLEDEWTQSVGNSDLLISYAQSQVAQGWVNDGVKVINLFYQNGTQAQDQVIQMSVAALVPPTGSPEPATLALMGLGGLVLAGRKRVMNRMGRQDAAIG